MRPFNTEITSVLFSDCFPRDVHKKVYDPLENSLEFERTYPVICFFIYFIFNFEGHNQQPAAAAASRGVDLTRRERPFDQRTLHTRGRTKREDEFNRDFYGDTSISTKKKNFFDYYHVDATGVDFEWMTILM